MLFGVAARGVSPAGNRQWRRWGAQAQTSGSTYRGHFNHVHVDYGKGSIGSKGKGSIKGFDYSKFNGGSASSALGMSGVVTDAAYDAAKDIADVGKKLAAALAEFGINMDAAALAKLTPATMNRLIGTLDAGEPVLTKLADAWSKAKDAAAAA